VGGVNGAEVIGPAPAGWVSVKTGGPAHVVSPAPKRRKVMVPVGLKAPERVAVSVTVPRRGTAAEATVEMVGAAWPTATDSLASLQAPAVGALLASPL
jgi:hypothetical protein